MANIGFLSFTLLIRGKYKEIIYEKVEYEKPKVILGKIKSLLTQIDENTAQLDVWLGEE